MRSYHHSSAHSPKNIVHLSHTIFIIIFCCLAGKANATAPNIIIFFADDLGYGDVGYQGGDLPTPHIDSIAHNGVRFTDGYVTCPVCAPSRAGLLTGRYQQRFGFSDNPGPYQRVERTICWNTSVPANSCREAADPRLRHRHIWENP